MHILLAPNAFKNSLSASEAAEALKKGLENSSLSCTCSCFPVGDGGDGTGELIIHHCGGETLNVQVRDPLGRKIKASYGLIDAGKTAVIELANASGLRLLSPQDYDPLHASTYGTGELIQHALEKQVNKIILCIGGSATVDGATGILNALGFRFLNKEGKELTDLPADLHELDSIDDSGSDKRMKNCRLLILCDVENVLLGKNGAANVFGPQKGADLSAIIKLEAALSIFRDVTHQQTGKDMALLKHGGAAGGVAAGLATWLNAGLVNGIDQFIELTGFKQALQKADLVITGEGSIDIQTLQGKGPYGVARIAKESGIPVIGLAGKLPLEIPPDLHRYFNVLLCINHESAELSKLLSETKENLERTAKSVGDLLALR